MKNRKPGSSRGRGRGRGTARGTGRDRSFIQEEEDIRQEEEPEISSNYEEEPIPVINV